MYIPHELAQNSTVYSTVLVALYWRYSSRLIDVMLSYSVQLNVDFKFRTEGFSRAMTFSTILFPLKEKVSVIVALNVPF